MILTIGLVKDVAAVVAEVVDAGWLVLVIVAAAGSEGISDLSRGIGQVIKHTRTSEELACECGH